MDDAAAHDRGQLDRLQRFLTRPGLDFGLALVLFVDPIAARRLRAEAIERAAAAGCCVSSLQLSTHDLTTDMLERLAQSLADADAVFVSGLDELLADTLGHARRTPALVNFNMRRDQLPARVPGRVVLWVSKRDYPLLAKLAWDLLQVSLTHFEFEAVDPVEVEPFRLPYIFWFETGAASNPSQALARAEGWRRQADSRSDARGTADASSIAANQYVSAGDLERAAEMFERAVEGYASVSAVEQMVRQLVPLARLHAYQGKIDLALAEAARALQSARSAGNWKLEVEASRLISDIHHSRADLPAAVQALEDLVAAGEQHADQQPLAAALARLGAIATDWAPAQREQLLERAAAMFAELEDQQGWASSRSYLADLRLAAGCLDEAQDIYLGEVLPVLEEQGNERGIARMRGRMAKLHALRGEFERALLIVRDEELPVYQRLGDRMSIVFSMLMIAELELRRGDLRASAEVLRDVIAAATMHRNLRLELFARLQLAHVFERDGHPDESTEQVNLARPLAAQLGIDLNLDQDLDQGDLTQALDRLRR